MSSANIRQENNQPIINKWRSFTIAAIILITLLSLWYLFLLFPFLTNARLAKSSSPDRACTIHVVDSEGGAPFFPSLLKTGQHIFIWKRWHLFPREIGSTKNYGDLCTLPQSTVSWAKRTASVIITSDEGGTDRFSFDTRKNFE